MKKLLLILAILCIAVAPVMVTVCHMGETTQVNINSLQAHLNHGDTLGACVENNHGNHIPTPTPTPPPPEPAERVSYLWLLTKSDPPDGWFPWCILRSPIFPSVEIQALPWMCGWVADGQPCADWLYDNDAWYCDVYGHKRVMRGR